MVNLVNQSFGQKQVKMTEVLIAHIKRYCTLSAEAAMQVEKSFITSDFKKRNFIVREGEACHRIYFVAKGCLRMFYLDEKGTEQTIQFALENWWMTDIDAFNKKGMTSFSIQAIEDAMVVSITKSDWDLLLQAQPALEKYFRIIYERAYTASLFKMRYFRLPKDEIYWYFCSKYPEFIQRIPQKLLASFLGFTPEYLSELRKRKQP